MKNRFYGLIIGCMAVGALATFLGPTIGSLSSAMRPIPALIARHLPLAVNMILFWIQVLLLFRRVALCIQASRIEPPSGLNKGWKIVLAIGAIPWLIGATVQIVPLILSPLLPGPFLFAMGIANAFIISYVWILVSNIFGTAFFLLEVSSVFKDGLFPRPNSTLQVTPESGRT